MRRLGIFSALAFLLTGCATVTALPAAPGARSSDGREVVETVAVNNTSWRLLCLLPIASGNPERPNAVSSRWFRDTATLQSQMDMVAAEAARCGAKQAMDVYTFETEEDVFLLAFLRRKMHTSAVLVR